MFTTKNGAAAVVLAIAAAQYGCSSMHTATHRWEAAAPQPALQYRRDNRSCSSEGRPRYVYPVPSAQFDEYRACMEESGYNLIAMSDVGE
ncbi:MAG: hypothetical protein AAF662_11295 [Pseudomonadota bacterium]